MSDHEVEGGAEVTRRPLPINSRRLTSPLLKQLAVGLGVPTAASLSEIRQLIEGKLGELGRDPQHTQVVLEDVERGTKIDLQDADGVFLEVEPPEPEAVPGGEENEEEVRVEGSEELREALATADREKEVLEEEVDDLWQRLELRLRICGG